MVSIDTIVSVDDGSAGVPRSLRLKAPYSHFRPLAECAELSNIEADAGLSLSVARVDVRRKNREQKKKSKRRGRCERFSSAFSCPKPSQGSLHVFVCSSGADLRRQCGVA